MAEDFRKGWEEFCKKATGHAGLLKLSLSELDEARSSSDTQKVAKEYLEAISSVIKPLIGAPYKEYIKFGGEKRKEHNFHELRTSYCNSTIRVDKNNRIKKVKLGFYFKGWARWLVCDEKKGAFRSYFFNGLRKKKNGKFAEALVKKDYSTVNYVLEEINHRLNALLDYLPKPFTQNVKSLEDSLETESKEEKKFHSFPEKLLEMEERLREKRLEMKEHWLLVSADEMVDLGSVPGLGLDGHSLTLYEVLSLFKKRDQRVPKIMGLLKEKSDVAFYSVAHALEAEAYGEFSQKRGLNSYDVLDELSYLKKCGVPIEECKKRLKLSLKKKEKERKKQADKFLEDLSEL